MQDRIQFRKAHANLYGAGSIEPNHPFMRGNTDGDRCEQNARKQQIATIHQGILHFLLRCAARKLAA
jgi:hypothetical protein